VLGLLALDQRGLTETLLRTYGFTRGMLAGLVRIGFATAQRQTVKAGGKTAEVVRIRITEAGRDALVAKGRVVTGLARSEKSPRQPARAVTRG